MALLASITAAFRGFGWCLTGDQRALDCYDFSERGFWQSFYASLFPLLVFAAVSQSIGAAEDIWTDHALGFALKQFVAGLLGWFPSLFILWLIARLCKSGSRYSIFVVLFNWSQFVILSVIIVMRLAYEFGWLDLSVLSVLDFIVIVVVFVFVFRAARIALAISWLGAFCMASADLVLSKTLAHVIHEYAAVLL